MLVPRQGSGILKSDAPKSKEQHPNDKQRRFGRRGHGDYYAKRSSPHGGKSEQTRSSSHGWHALDRSFYPAEWPKAQYDLQPPRNFQINSSMNRLA